MLPFGVNYRLQLASLGKKREEGVKPTFKKMSKAASAPQTNHSQYSSPVKALNIDRRLSRSLCPLSSIIRPLSRYMCRRGERKACSHIVLWILVNL